MKPVEILKRYWKILAVLTVVLILYPKNTGYGYGGEIMPNQISVIRTEKVCLGVRYEMFGGPFMEKRCLDCNTNIYCIGIPLQEKCYEKKLDVLVINAPEQEISCNRK